MIQYIVGNLLESEAQVLVNTVNTVGVMGKGIALQFKTQFPHNFKIYAQACKEKTLQIGELLTVEDHSSLYGKKTIVNFPTKTDWRRASDYQYIEKGLQALVTFVKAQKITSMAIPPLGVGNGGLEWAKVRTLMEQYLSPLPCHIYIYEPNTAVKEVLKKERVALTPARAMLLAVLYDLVANGEFVSEFASEKVAYFLQRFGANDFFKLSYQPNFYGPYSGKVKHVLHYLNGSYLNGYSAKDKKPFEPLDLIRDAEADVWAFLTQKENQTAYQTVLKTKSFLSGFYSNFGLELLSTLDYIVQMQKTKDLELIKQQLEQWSSRKTKLFAKERFLQIGIQHLEKHLP